MSAYQRELRQIDIDRGWIDFYTIADLYNLDPIIGHSIKKLLAAGHRNGGKSKLQDLREARNQLDRAISELEFEASNRESDIEAEVERERDGDQGVAGINKDIDIFNELDSFISKKFISKKKI